MKRQLMALITFIVLGTNACLAGETAATATDGGAVGARTEPPPGGRGDGGDQPSGIGMTGGAANSCLEETPGTGDGCDQPAGIPAAADFQ